MAVSELDVVYATCPNNHKFGTVKPTGTMIKCQRCFRELDKTVMVMVPPRPAEPPKRIEVNWGTEECRTCGDTATRRFVGPCCGSECAVAELRKTSHLMTQKPAGRS